MGGKEGSRGYLYQGFVAVMESLVRDDWDMIYVEFPSSNDKVDIALEKDKRLVKSIQVKSTVNSFSKVLIIDWIKALIKDTPSLEYNLYLIGDVEKPAITFINSIDKYYNKELDQKSQNALNGFSTKLLDEHYIKIVRLPFDLETLQSLVRDALHEFISDLGYPLTYEQIKFISHSVVSEQMISSTHGKGISRDQYYNDLKKAIYLISQKYEQQRIALGIKSFEMGSEKMVEQTTHMLSLLDMFNGRYIKDQYTWDNDIFSNVKQFLIKNTNNEDTYKISLDTHLSIAFMAGRVSESKRGINIFPVQKTQTDGLVLWDVNPTDDNDYSLWEISNESHNRLSTDSILILNITRTIYDDVLSYLAESNVVFDRVINCNICNKSANNTSIINGTHANSLANSVYKALAQRSTAERRSQLHIFVSGPASFMFFLGQVSKGFGKCSLYEFDFENQGNCSYYPSISFPVNNE